MAPETYKELVGKESEKDHLVIEGTTRPNLQVTVTLGRVAGRKVYRTWIATTDPTDSTILRNEAPLTELSAAPAPREALIPTGVKHSVVRVSWNGSHYPLAAKGWLNTREIETS